MYWQFNYISLIYLLTAVVCLQLMQVIYSMKQIKGKTPFQWMMLMSAFWSIVLVFESAAPSIGVKVRWSQFEYIASMTIPLFFLRFILSYEPDNKAWIRRFFYLFLIVPVAAIILVFTNELHHLVWTGFTWSPAGLNILIYQHGIIFYIINAYALGLILFSMITLLLYIRNRPDDFTDRTRYLVLSASIPFLTGLLYMSGLTPVEGLNISPMGILVFGVIYLRGTAREQLFDLVPFSRQLMVERMADGVIVLDKNLIIREFSPSATSLLNPVTDPVGQKIKGLFNFPEDIFSDGEALEEIHREVRQEGESERWVELYNFPLKSPTGKMLGSVLLVHDITKRKQTESELQRLAKELTELNRMKDRLYSVIGHDLRNPFNALLGYSQLMVEAYDEFDEEERKKFAISINQVARSTFDLLENLLEWSSAQLGRVTFLPENLRLFTIVEETLQPLTFLASGKDIGLVNGVPTDLEVYADKNMLMTIIRNLISNGIKFTSKKGTVEVFAIRRGEYTEIIIADTGIGMLPQVADQLFRADSMITTHGTADEKGSGLGLLLAREFVERHGGKIRVSSEPGLGSRFIVTLPNRKNV